MVTARAMIDLHSHILPGVDDGPESVAGSLEIARAAAADGIEAIAATPHVRWDYPTSPEAMEAGVESLREELAAAAIPMRLLPGGELDLEQLQSLEDADLRRFGLGGNPEYLLVEFPYTGWPLGLAEIVFHLATSRIRAVIAHPERNAEVQAAPERLGPIVDGGALIQVTAASVDGRLGRRSERCAMQLIEGGWAHMIASDAHEAFIRSVGMAAAAGRVGDDALARWLTDDVPRAIVDGSVLPRRPEVARRRLPRPWR
jgi:protein-tyrosine phosphatase